MRATGASWLALSRVDHFLNNLIIILIHPCVQIITIVYLGERLFRCSNGACPDTKTRSRKWGVLPVGT